MSNRISTIYFEEVCQGITTTPGVGIMGTKSIMTIANPDNKI
jgi:hypothetical protein